MKMKELGPKWGARPCRPPLTIESPKKSLTVQNTHPISLEHCRMSTNFPVYNVIFNFTKIHGSYWENDNIAGKPGKIMEFCKN